MLKCVRASALSLTVALLGMLLPSCSMGKAADLGRGESLTGQPPPGGLVAVIADTPGKPLDLKVLANPYVSGVALQIHWSELEPAEAKPDFAKLDALFTAAQSAKKFVHLLVFPGFFTPSWALQGVQSEAFALQYGPGHGTVAQLPVPWDPQYLNRWFGFLREVSDRYGTSPAFKVIAADGPTSVSAETTLPNSHEAVEKWQRLGYTPSKYIGAWQTVLAKYATIFPNQYVSLSAGNGQVPINERGAIVKGGEASTRQTIVDDAMHALGDRFVLQSSNVHAGPGPHSQNSQADDKFVIGYSGRVTTGLQMRSAALNSSAVMGAKGSPPLALRKSVDLALERNATGHHVDYLEIYEPDVVATEMQPVLRYAASLFASGTTRK